MAVDINDVTTIAGTIGPRPAGSAYERRAAGYVASRLRQLGIPNTTLPVRIPRSFGLIYVTLFLLAAVSVPLARLSGWLGLLVSLVALVLIAFEATDRPLLRRLAAGRQGQNVLGLISPPDAETAEAQGRLRRVILSAHLDSARSGLISQPPIIAWSRPLILFVAGSLLLLPLLHLVFALTGSMIPWYISLVPGLYLLGAAALILEREIRGVPVAGANNGASGIAAVLGVAAMLQRQPPANLEIWLLFTAGAETGSAGMNQFLTENRFDPDRTYFIHLGAVGGGSVRFSRAEGLLFLRRSSPVLMRIAGTLARERPNWGVRPQTHRQPATDQSAALAHGYQAISIFGADGEGLIPNWHQTSDTPERVDMRTVATATDLALAMIRRLDREAAESPPVPEFTSRS